MRPFFRPVFLSPHMPSSRVLFRRPTRPMNPLGHGTRRGLTTSAEVSTLGLTPAPLGGLMRTLTRPIAWLVLLIGLVVGCGDSDSSGPSVSLTGTYNGTQTFTTGSRSGSTVSLSLSLIQNGSSITGSYSNGAGDSGSFTGTLSGLSLNGTAQSAVSGSSCAFQGTSDSIGVTINGTIACSSGSGSTASVTKV